MQQTTTALDNRPSAVAFLATGLAIILLVASCSVLASEEEDAVDFASQTEREAGSQRDSAVELSGAYRAPKGEPSPTKPLDELLMSSGLVPREFFDDLSERRSDRNAMEESIRTCMADQGFEYFASPPPLEPKRPEEGSIEWVNEYGFGHSTLLFEESVVGPNLRGRESSPKEALDTSGDLAIAYENSLTAEEYDAYRYALYGEIPGEPDPSDSNSPDCHDIAWYQFAREGEDKFAEFVDYFGVELQAVPERVASDSRLLDAEQQIRDCMEANGYTGYTDLDQYFIDAQIAAQGFLSNINVASSISSLSEQEAATLSDEELAEIFESSRQLVLSNDELRDLEQLQRAELETASILQKCGGIDQLELLRSQLESEYQRLFIEENEGAVLVFMEQASAG